MFKRFTIILAVLIMTAGCLSSTVFAYSNMYTSTSGIPDYSEVTGSTFIEKDYMSGGTMYYYLNDGNASIYPNYLTQNGYVLFDIKYIYSVNMYSRIYVNLNKGLGVIFAEAEDISIITIFQI